MHDNLLNAETIGTHPFQKYFSLSNFPKVNLHVYSSRRQVAFTD